MSWDKVESDISSGPLGLLKWIVLTVVLFSLLTFGLWAIFKPAGVAVERVVFKNSFQYKEGMAQRGAILEANLAEIDMQIIKNPDKRKELEAQKKVIQAQLRAITIND